MPTASILLTGATGYIGGLLLARLQSRGLRVRCLARRADRLTGRTAAGTEVVEGDCLDERVLDIALRDVDLAYFLVHSMADRGAFAHTEREAALRFGRAAARARVGSIVYLGGLGDEADGLSAHLRSRREVGDALRESGVPVLEFRASIVVGAGSLSFELVRALVERLPVMVCPRWVAVKAQPIAIEDVLDYLQAATDAPPTESIVCEIGGPDAVSYGEIMREYARQRGLTRRLIPIPLLTPRLSSLWLRLVTPLQARVGRWLIDGMRNRTVVRDPLPARRFPIAPRTLARAIEEAIAQRGDRIEALLADLPGRDAAGTVAGLRACGCLVDSREVDVAATAAEAFAPVRTIGGDTGWYLGNALWRLRGWLDRATGGAGFTRGRRDARECVVGDPIDAWRVAAIEADRRLTLRAGMRVPGRAWLQFDVVPGEDGRRCRIRQTALFDPHGVAGLIYWCALLPVHAVLFSGMLRGIARRAASRTR